MRRIKLNSTTVIFDKNSDKEVVYKLPKASRYIKLNFEGDKLTSFTIEYEMKRIAVDMTMTNKKGTS